MKEGELLGRVFLGKTPIVHEFLQRSSSRQENKTPAVRHVRPGKVASQRADVKSEVEPRELMLFSIHGIASAQLKWVSPSIVKVGCP
jgi:hypothetical protein